MDFRTLKSGSDVRGIAVGEDAVLTQEVARTLGRAFVRFLAQRKGQPAEQITVALGRDSRVSGPSLLAATAAGIATEGATANDYGMASNRGEAYSFFTFNRCILARRRSANIR